MSHHLTQVTVLGLWGGDEVLRLKFDRQFNFLIGKNGSGKTTLINLLAAVLLADFESLDKIQFTEVVVHLKPLVGQKRPRIVVTKTGKKNLPYADIAYKIWLSSKESIEFDLDALAEEQSYRGLPNRYLRDRVFHERFVFVQTQLKELLDVTWLSVHRGPDELDRKDERRVIPAVDRKLASLNIELVKYFSRLAKDFEGATDEFQKKSFLSLTNVDEFSNVKTFAETVDTRAEATALASVFDLLGVSKDAYEGPLNKGLETFDGAREKFLSKSSMTFADIFSVSNAYRAHALVQFYDVLREQREKIFKPRDGFLRVLNSLLNPKKVANLSAVNELELRTSKGRTIPLDELSSGEKQLIIILGQTLLQEGAGAIYIADEPELSLHVEWQELLTGSIEQLNPNVQIVFATHSPDIVGRHTNCVIDMEDVI